MTNQNSNRKLIITLSAIAIGMFGFAFALVPLYNAMCKTLGINGKTSGTAAALSTEVDNSRTIQVLFIGNIHGNMPWTFRPITRSINIHPGENKQVAFLGRNNSDHPIMMQAIPSISPGQAAKYFKKTQCFCFTQHTLPGKTSMRYPLVFHIDKHLPKNIHEVTLSYTLFDLTKHK